MNEIRNVKNISIIHDPNFLYNITYLF